MVKFDDVIISKVPGKRKISLSQRSVEDNYWGENETREYYDALCITYADALKILEIINQDCGLEVVKEEAELAARMKQAECSQKVRGCLESLAEASKHYSPEEFRARQESADKNLEMKELKLYGC